jgi:predicted nucleic acid-binding protein
MIVADTSGLLAFFNRREPRHRDVRRIVEGEPEPLVVSPYVVAEIDYLVATQMGLRAAIEVLKELAGGGYDLPHLGQEDLSRLVTVIERYGDQEIGAADASLVVLASRYGTRAVLTLDHRHFRVLRPLEGGRFQLLP